MLDTWGHVRAGHYIIVTIISARHVVARTEDGGEIGDTLITFVLHTDNTPGTQGDTGNLEISDRSCMQDLTLCGTCRL